MFTNNVIERTEIRVENATNLLIDYIQDLEVVVPNDFPTYNHR